MSSGAVGMGMRVLGLKERPRSLGMRQACAAVGQGHLMGVYTQAFAQLGVTAAQVLLTQEDLADRDRALCLRTTLMRLLELGAVPVLNENDSVSVARAGRAPARRQAPRGAASPAVGFGDNDGLSARVAVSLDADLLVLLTNVGGPLHRQPARRSGGDAHPRAGGRRRRGARARQTAARRAAPAAWPASWRRRGSRPPRGRRCSSRAAPSRACIERALARRGRRAR